MKNTKYDPLARHLSNVRASVWRARFSEIENILGSRLPDSARRHRAWWSNNGGNNVMTKSWKSAGWITEQVDMDNEVLVFRKVAGPVASPSRETPLAGSSKGKFDFDFGRLKGTVTWIGDLTDPADETWNAEQGLL